MSAAPLLLYDGTCAFCAARVQFVLRHDRRGTLRFASLQGTTGTALRARHPELEDVDSVVWAERDENAHEHLFIRSAAALRVLSYLGGRWRWLGAAGHIVPRILRDRVYDLIARHRHHLARGGPACLVPTAEQRARFLD